MKRTLLIVVVALAVLTGAFGIAWSSSGGYAPPHSDYRTGYSGGCSGGTACHTITKGTFLPENLDNPASAPYSSYTNFCLSCHNTTGEAHEKSAGSPSTNAYVGLTSIDKSASYNGDSHSWKGQNGNAGTRTPVAAGYAGTNFMPGGVVQCQTCHTGADKSQEQNIAGASGEWLQAVDQGDQKSYKISGSASTKQYLAQYLKVFRYPTAVTSPASRAKKAYQIYTGFSYNYQNATITFGRPQGAVGSIYIYANIGQPYLRVGNGNNAACVDCHSNRKDSSVSHSPGTGVKDQHPTSVKYGYNFGLHSTLMAAPTGNVYLEYTATVGNRVLCTSCHDPHNAASKNGQILRETDGSALCADCHKTKLAGYSTANSVNAHNGSKHSSPTVCLDCHTTHGSNNILMIKPVINGRQINFQNFSGANSFAPGTGTGLCEVCHAALGHHNADGTGTGHHDNDSCIKCHSHSSGFQPVGGGSCDSCHGFPPPPAPSGWATTADKHSGHMTYIFNKFGLTGTAACAKCHGSSIPRANHNTGASGSSIIDTSAWGGGTFTPSGIAKDPYNDTCANVSCHNTTDSRTWGGVSSTACDSCHEYPMQTVYTFPTFYGSTTIDQAITAYPTRGYTSPSTITDWNKGAIYTPGTAGNKKGIWTLPSGKVVNSNGHTVMATYDQNVNGRGTQSFLRHLNVGTAYNPTLDTYSAVTADPNKCGKCHPHVVGNPNHNHQNGFIELAPNGYGQGGGNFNVTVTQTGSQVRCSNVACHFNRDTPTWW